MYTFKLYRIKTILKLKEKCLVLSCNSKIYKLKQKLKL